MCIYTACEILKLVVSEFELQGFATCAWSHERTGGHPTSTQPWPVDRRTDWSLPKPTECGTAGTEVERGACHVYRFDNHVPATLMYHSFVQVGHELMQIKQAMPTHWAFNRACFCHFCGWNIYRSSRLSPIKAFRRKKSFASWCPIYCCCFARIACLIGMVRTTLPISLSTSMIIKNIRLKYKWHRLLLCFVTNWSLMKCGVTSGL